MRKSKRRFRDRALAWFLALMMIVGSLYSGNLTTLNVYAEETSTVETESGTPDVPDEPNVVVEKSYAIHVTMPEDSFKTENVDWGNVSVVISQNGIEVQTVSLDSAKQGTATLTPGDYSYEVKCDNYNINLNPGKNVFTCSESDSQPIVIVLSNAEILNSVGGKFSAGQVETKSILVNDTAELFAAVDAAAWESVIQWETADPAKVSIDGSSTGKNCTVKAAGLTAADTPVTVTAKIGSIVLKTYTISVVKRPPVLTVATSAQQPWGNQVTISGTLMDGTTPLASKDIKITVVGVSSIDLGTVTTDDEGNYSKAWTPGVMGDYTISATYVGDDTTYAGATGLQEYTTGKKAQDFTLDTTTIESMAFGDIVYVKPTAEKTGMSTDFVFNDNLSGMVEIGGYVKDKGYPIKAVGVSDKPITITVTQTENGSYNASDPQTVTIKKIVKKSVKLTEVEATNRPYNGTNSVDVTADLTAEYNGVETKVAQLTAKGTVETADAGTGKPVKVTFSLSDDQAKVYDLPEAALSPTGVTVNISKKSLTLTVGNASVDYTDRSNAQALVYAAGVLPVTISGFISGEDAAKVTAPTVAIDESKLVPSLRVGETYAGVLYAQEGTGTPTDNYEFDFNGQTRGNLTLLEEKVEDFSEYIDIDNANSSHVYQVSSGNGIFYYQPDAAKPVKAVFKSLKSGYNKVWLISTTTAPSGDKVESKEEITSEKPYDFSQGSSVRLQLSNKEDTLRTGIFVVTFTSDKNAPIVEIIDEKDGPIASVLKDLASALPFDYFKQDTWKVKVDISDNESGVNKAKTEYYVCSVTKDVTQQTYGEILEAGEKVTADDNGEILITKDAYADGNYVVFVLAEDNVGNSTLVGSNGVVLDSVFAQESITLDYDKEDGSYAAPNTVDNVDYFNADVPMKVTVYGNAGNVFSGVDYIKYSVTADGELKVKNSYLKETKPAPEKTTLEYLSENFEAFTKTFDIDTIAADSSAKVDVSVEAADFAGNTVRAAKGFVIDKKAPEIENVYTYDASKNPVKTDDGTTTYTNKNVTLTTTITERYISYDNISYTIDGTAYSLTVLKENADGLWAKLGIVSVNVNPETPNIDTATDEAKTIVTIEFGSADESLVDKDYSVSVDVTDFAGNTSKSETEKFVIDKVAPTAKVVYAKVGGDVIANPSKDSTVPTYYNQKDYPNGVSATFEVTERNFAEINYGDGALWTITAKDSSDKNVELALKADWDNTDNQKYIRKLTLNFDKDAIYTLNFAYTDLAGNKAVYDEEAGNSADAYAEDYFVIDRVAPKGSITVDGFVNTEDGETSKTWDTLASAGNYNWFSKDGITVTLENSDATADMASTGYYVSEKLLDAAALDALTEWNSVSAVQKFAASYQANQNLIAYMRVEDKAGNYAFYSTENIIIDDKASGINISVTPEGPENNKEIYNASEIKNFTVTVEEPENAYAGIQNVEYTLTDDIAGLVKTESGDTPWKAYSRDKGTTPHQRTMTDYIDIKDYASKTLDHSYDLTLDVITTDWAGNTNSAAKTITIDPVRPKVENVYTSAAKRENSKYYKADVLLTTTVTERYLDLDNDVIYHINGKNIALAELKAAPENYGISKVEVEHQTTDSDQDKVILKVTFHADDNYCVSVSVADKAGNAGEYTTIVKGSGADDADLTVANNVFEFVVDHVAPVASLNYVAYKGNSSEAIAAGKNGIIKYLGEDYSGGFRAILTIDELNFDAKDVEYTMTAKDSKGNDILAEAVSGYAADAATGSSWKTEGEITRIFEKLINDDANYTLTCKYTDLAGNVGVTTVDFITLDRVKPTGTITATGLVSNMLVPNSANQTWANRLLSEINYKLFGKDNLAASITSDDVTAGVSSTWYLTSAEVLTEKELAARTDWKSYKDGSLPLKANQNVIVYEKIIDKAGNTSYYSSDNMVADNTSPSTAITITPTAPSWGKGVYRESDRPGFDVVVEDPMAGNGSYAGLKNITYSIYVDGVVVQSGTLKEFACVEHNINQRWTGHVDLSAYGIKRFYSNNVRLQVQASDWSLNTQEVQSESIKVDTEAPKVSFELDNSGVLNGKYYNQTKTLKITVDERNFDASYEPKVTATNGSGYSFSGWSFNGKIATGYVHFTGDGDYSVTYDCYDLAGNKSNTETMNEITIDKTTPVISVSYDNNNARNGHYYNASRTATITITEHNFNASEVSVQTTAQGASAPGVSGWSTSGDRHTATVTFGSDADYTFDVSYTDLAGNAAADYAQESFTVDLTNPEVEISGVANKSANKGTVAPVITLSDTNYDTQGITITLIGSERGRVDISNMLTTATMANGQTMTFLNFGEGMDDIYTLTAEAVDMAGNETSKSITFSVNRDGSTYKINESTKELLEKGYTNSPKDIVIQEINVDTLKFVELTYSKNGKVVKLTEGKDYTVEVSQTEGQWKIYTYTIKASCFEGEGDYVINIYSEDEAENATTNKAKQTTIEFVVDKTPPTIVISNLEDGGRYKEESHEFTLSVKDNTHLAYIEYYLDGQLVKTYEGEELTVEDGVIKISLDSAGSYQTVQIKAYDAAGNEIASDEYSVLVTSSAWIQFYMNKPLFYGVIAAIIIALALIIFLIGKRRKDDDEKKQA
ncbi:Ig-like domain-containing protein [Frisingicoccus sp.]|uniref:Ig-like domain-containing protein n=1 Tax=Frisingicoccus sp. TaxID=1918627 RepID=UPI003AB34B1C